MARGPGYTLIYRSYPLDRKNEKITRAFVMVHGAGRDANNYFRHAVAAAFLADALGNTIVIAPRFASNQGERSGCRDTLATNEINWNSCGGDTWRSGSPALRNKNVTSFDVTDEILRKLARKEIFPNLKSIVVAGHSAGGQYVNRYEMANQVHDKLGIDVSYVVANPSSYAWPDSTRPRTSALPADVAALPPGYIAPRSANPPAPFGTFGDSDDCTTYDDWPYGFRNRVGYTAKISDDQLKKQLASRSTTYLVGELDILPLYGFDGSCPAMAQGPTRLARGLAFGRYVNEKFGAKHTTIVVAACGHNARCMFTADTALAIVFRKRD
jgi:pimeloyl-ACP methyl ester carboxylesterase